MTAMAKLQFCNFVKMFVTAREIHSYDPVMSHIVLYGPYESFVVLYGTILFIRYCIAPYVAVARTQPGKPTTLKTPQGKKNTIRKKHNLKET